MPAIISCSGAFIYKKEIIKNGGALVFDVIHLKSGAPPVDEHASRWPTDPSMTSVASFVPG